MKKKKETGFLLHILFVVLVLAGVTIMYTNVHYGEGIRWITQETYEDTPEFTRQLKSDIDNIFNYIKYKEVFETDGKLDYNKPAVRVMEGPGLTKTYTVDEMVRKAKSYGFYLNENFKVSGGQPGNYEDEDGIRVEYRAYAPDLIYTEPGDPYTSMYELSREVLSHLGNYYGFFYKFIHNPSNLKFRVVYHGDGDALDKTYTNAASKTDDELRALGKYLYVTGEALYVDTNLTSTPKNVSAQLEKMNPYDNSNYYMIVAVDTGYPYLDAYHAASKSYDQMRLLFIVGMVSLAIGILGCAATLYVLVCMTGHVDVGPGIPGDTARNAVSLGWIDCIPLESSLVLFFLAFACVFFGGTRIGYKIMHLFLSEETWFYGELACRVMICYGCGLAVGFSLIRRYKAGSLWQNTLARRLLDNFRLYFKNHKFTNRLVVCYTLFLAFQAAMLLAVAFLFFTYDSMASRILIGVLAAVWLLTDLWVFHQMYKNAWETDRINEAVVRISRGDTAYKIKADGFLGKEQELAENINHISSGLETALQEKVRSERLKADLITNVSHDIKTPLTSIINYVDLIKREKIQDPKIQGYLDVLEQKSQRLKTLTEDLVEASKASSGNLKMEMADIDFVELIQQTNGEFEEKFGLRHLELISNLPEGPVLIRADGRHLWRVLENIYNNTFKYAMERSRVYVDITEGDGMVTFSMKNISENPLNIRAEELTERFVRGDVARTTEGSGLGLSIARSLTELLGGQFTIYIDGDFFKAMVSFPKLENEAGHQQEPEENIQ